MASIKLCGDSCSFHDIVQGSNAEPCVLGTLTNPLTGATCNAETSEDWPGIASGYNAGTGYDAASGLGSINAANLFASWSSAISNDAASVTTHELVGATSVPYGTSSNVQVSVKASSGTSTPSGAVTIMSTESDNSSLALASGDLASGTELLSFDTLVPGTHHIYASYGGDASFGASSSTPTEFVVTKATTTLSATPSKSQVIAPDSVTAMDIDLSSTKQGSATITISSGNGTSIVPSSLLLAC